MNNTYFSSTYDLTKVKYTVKMKNQQYENMENLTILLF